MYGHFFRLNRLPKWPVQFSPSLVCGMLVTHRARENNSRGVPVNGAAICLGSFFSNIFTTPAAASAEVKSIFGPELEISFIGSAVASASPYLPRERNPRARDQSARVGAFHTCQSGQDLPTSVLARAHEHVYAASVFFRSFLRKSFPRLSTADAQGHLLGWLQHQQNSWFQSRATFVRSPVLGGFFSHWVSFFERGRDNNGTFPLIPGKCCFAWLGCRWKTALRTHSVPSDEGRNLPATRMKSWLKRIRHRRWTFTIVRDDWTMVCTIYSRGNERNCLRRERSGNESVRNYTVVHRDERNLVRFNKCSRAINYSTLSHADSPPPLLKYIPFGKIAIARDVPIFSSRPTQYELMVHNNNASEGETRLQRRKWAVLENNRKLRFRHGRDKAGTRRGFSDGAGNVGAGKS